MGIPAPPVNPEVGSGSHASQTAEILKRIEPVLEEHRPHVVVVVGGRKLNDCAFASKAKAGKVPLLMGRAGSQANCRDSAASRAR